ncbi:Isochorismatase-like protein [Nemania sp. FL0031]|nr:Isochorismatase-like protein [Nemania sp. FL0031]
MSLSRVISRAPTRFHASKQLRFGSKFTSLIPLLRLGPRLSSTMTDPVPSRRLQNPVIFVCDLQDKFRNAIWQFDKILLTSQKVLRAAQILKIPVIATTQNGQKLGPIVAELQPLIQDAAVHADKTLFSMLTSEVTSHELLSPTPKREIAIVGIESHICVTQTALDLIARGHKVYVLADGVSSCNEQEIPIALARLRAEGVVVTTSESWLYETMGDAGIAEFRDIAKLVRETAPDTKTALSGLLSKI